jgi:hypothetical protein
MYGYAAEGKHDLGAYAFLHEDQRDEEAKEAHRFGTNTRVRKFKFTLEFAEDLFPAEPEVNGGATKAVLS